VIILRHNSAINGDEQRFRVIEASREMSFVPSALSRRYSDGFKKENSSRQPHNDTSQP
jgi:hypothetical protein